TPPRDRTGGTAVSAGPELLHPLVQQEIYPAAQPPAGAADRRAEKCRRNTETDRSNGCTAGDRGRSGRTARGEVDSTDAVDRPHRARTDHRPAELRRRAAMLARQLPRW